VVDAAAFNIYGYLWRDAFVLYLSWKGLFGTNRAYVHLETIKLEEYSSQN
jgi:hypothetical protein